MLQFCVLWGAGARRGEVGGKEIVLHSNLVWLFPKAKIENRTLVQVICMRSDPSNQDENRKSQMGRKKSPLKNVLLIWLPLRTTGTEFCWGSFEEPYRMCCRFILQRPWVWGFILCLHFPLVDVGTLTLSYFQAMPLLGWVSCSSLRALFLSYQDHCTRGSSQAWH